MYQDFLELLKLFHEEKVKYLLVGGYAVILYTEPRYTKDIDIWIETSKNNAPRVFKALKKFGAPLSNLSVQDFETDGFFYTMGNPPFRVDILMMFKGVSFTEAFERKTTQKFQGMELNCISREDLIKNKEATGRTQDLADVEKLKKFKN